MKLRCKKCNDIIEGDKKGTYILANVKQLLLMKRLITGEL